MIVINEPLLDIFREKVRCEWCNGMIVGRADPSHLWARGLGGGHRLDVSINLMAQCRFCHGEYHAGHIARHDLLLIVAGREGVMQSHIELVIHWLRRLPKEATDADVARRLKIMAPGPAALAAKVWAEVQGNRCPERRKPGRKGVVRF